MTSGENILVKRGADRFCCAKRVELSFSSGAGLNVVDVISGSFSSLVPIEEW